MKFTVDAAAFNAALTAPAKIAKGALHLTVADDTLTLLADDTVVRIEIRVPVTDAARGEATVPSALMRDIVHAMPPGPVTVDASGGGRLVEIQGGDDPDGPGPVRASMWQITGETIPRPPEDPPLVGELDLAVFAKAMSQVMPAVSNDFDRPALTGVSVRPARGGKLALAASDSYRLHVTEADMVDAVSWDHQALIPGEAIRWILSVFDGDTATLRLDRKLVSVRSDTATLTARLLDPSSFPSVIPLLPDPKKAAAAVSVDAAALLEAFARVNPIAKLGYQHVAITGFPEDTRLVLETKAPDVGVSTATVRAHRLNGAGFTFGCHIQYITAAVKASGAERLDLWWHHDGGPMLITAFGDPGYQAVVSALRLPKGK